MLSEIEFNYLSYSAIDVNNRFAQHCLIAYVMIKN